MQIALANVRCPSTPDESVAIALDAMSAAADGEAAIVCFPECFVPGYRTLETVEPPNQQWLNDAWATIDAKAAEVGICVILGTERFEGDRLLITARVTNSDGSLAGFQDKVQLDPSEEPVYSPGTKRRVFQCGDVSFSIVICHEGWRYPETVRWAARNGAHVVFHPHFELVDNDQFVPSGFADPQNTFHEKAALCRAAENTCYFATVNCALPGATTTSALIDPQGVLLSNQPYGQEGILFGEINTQLATRHWARRLKPSPA